MLSVKWSTKILGTENRQGNTESGKRHEMGRSRIMDFINFKNILFISYFRNNDYDTVILLLTHLIQSIQQFSQIRSNLSNILIPILQIKKLRHGKIM